ncbi:MAG: hypothetical protein ACRENE_20505 [Polyangiaceae bacterium]
MPPNPAASSVKTGAAPPKVRRQRLGVRLSQPLLRRLRQYAAAKGRKESAIIEDLVTDYLASGGGRHTQSSPSSPVDRLVAAINDDRAAHAAQLGEVVRAVELLSEAFGTFVGLWMTTADPLPADESMRAAVGEVSAANYDYFARTVVAHFLRGHRFAHDLPDPRQVTPPRAPRASGGASSGQGGGKV